MFRCRFAGLFARSCEVAFSLDVLQLGSRLELGTLGALRCVSLRVRVLVDFEHKSLEGWRRLAD